MEKKKAISAILGTTIALVIVFTIFIPLIMYIQSLQTIFMQEANRRLQYELERIHEKLEVHLTITPKGEVFPNNYFWVIIHNPGILTVSIPTIYIESRNKGIIEVSKQFLIPPGGIVYYKIEDFYLSTGDEDDLVRVKVVTLRGNSFISHETLGPTELPYHFIVIISNMSFGHKYKITVDQIGNYGCVTITTKSEVCGSTKEVVIIPQSFSDTEGLAIFKVAPGTYRVSVEDLINNSEIKSEIVEVYDDVILNIQVPKIEFPEVAPLRIDIVHKNLTLVLTGSQGSVTIPYIVYLGTFTESLSKIEVKIEYNGGIYQKQISELYPGGTRLDNFTIPFTLSESEPGKIINYNIKIIQAIGEISKRRYTGTLEGEYKIEKYKDSGEIKVCVIRTLEGLLPEPIPYIQCPS